MQSSARALACLLVGLVVAVLPVLPGQAAPYLPHDDDVVLEQLPIARDAALQALATQRRALAREPDNLPLALDLAEALLDLARASADPRYEGYAQAALAPWWDLAQPPLQVRLLRANLLQRRHQFAAALGNLDAVLAQDPRQPQAWLSRAMILAAQGRPAAAAAACHHLVAAVPPLIRAGCRAHADRLQGLARQTYQDLREILAGTRVGASEHRAWALTILAETADQLGDDQPADRHYRAALSLTPDDPYLLASFADYLLATGRAAETAALLAERTAIDALLLRLAMAEQRLQADTLQDHLDQLAARFAAAERRGDRVHLRERARFLLTLRQQPHRALVLAQANWQAQRERADAALLLEAALAADKPAAAAPVLAWLEATGLEDHRLAALAARCAALSS